MYEEEIRSYAGLMEELQLTGLEVEAEGVRFRLERQGAPVAPVAVAQPAAAAPAQSGKSEAAGDLVEVTSPMVGVFYSSPAENAEPFVTTGSHVKKGDVLCIIEAMKLLNEITAEQDGEIVDICAHNADVVEYGQTLFKIF